MAKEKQIPKLSDDVTVKIAQQKLLSIQQKFERATNYPLVDDTERARALALALLDGKILPPKKESDEAVVLSEAMQLAASRLQEAQRIAAEKIIKEITPAYLKVREELLTECLRLKEALDVHDNFIQSLLSAGLSNFLPASWSMKRQIVGFFPGGRLDLLVENLRLPA